jgi:hypothetical protein
MTYIYKQKYNTVHFFKLIFDKQLNLYNHQDISKFIYKTQNIIFA